MTHMVIFRTADGKPDYHQADDLAEAMAFVERLRNEDSISDARIFHMEEVPIEFRTCCRVATRAACSSLNRKVCGGRLRRFARRASATSSRS